MNSDLDSVKTAQTYHHGDLRSALVEAATATLRERGIDGFSLRETARRAGVSAAAPQHHFGDARGLLTAVATEGFRLLGDALAEADERSTSRDGRIRSQGAVYLNFALKHPGEFDTMWRCARIDPTDASYRAASERAFGLLAAAVADRPYSPHVASSGPDPRAVACWSLVHGLARLALDGVFGPPDAAAAAIDRMLDPVMDCLVV
ncbi:MAG: TetR/AcrR family transcriptional regulator [Methylobacterium sp.]|uniref:TetR/AcrR family transcriptional regulator n=1 Tax=Methylobacterium sp. TaxID=409 RepID=UPI0025CE17C6|nr:TetR/AcrR family transcriptional regulator [Methylobacterium sp.]MBX9930099.1 TetR/AcrR family transcriptional regulator [Methylobacterium sp.]